VELARRTEDDSVAVVIPAFDEGDRVGAVVAGCRERFPLVIVVDDGSTDATFAVARAAGAEVVRHPINLGQGAALQTGIARALELGATWIVTMDADGQHDPTDGQRLVRLARDHGWDACLGSRFLGGTIGMPRGRRALLRLALAFQRFTTGLKLTDVHNGLRALSRHAAMLIDLRQDRMAHASEFVSVLGRLGLSFGEGPVTIRYTRGTLAKGQNSLSALQIVVDLLLARLGR
jgi:polyprenyl-phospho-N-acetylgalactosaminyl synthase